MPARVLLIAATTGYQTRMFARAARRLGAEITLATDRCHILEDPWGDNAIPIRFEQLEASARALANRRFDGVIALGDRPTLLAARVAQSLGIPYHPVAAVEACHDKYAARRIFEAAGLPVPAYLRVPVGTDPVRAARNVSYPCVLKPLGLSASRGVIRADNPAGFAAAFRRIERILETPELLRLQDTVNEFIQVEAFIPGREYAVEGLMTEGRLEVLALFDKPDPLDGPFFEETIYVTPSRAPAEVQRAIISAVETGARALGLRHGPLHAELRHNESCAWLLEIAARPIGGLCAQALRFESDMSLEELIIRHAAGENTSGVRLARPAAGVMMIPIPKEGIYEGVSGEDEAAAVTGIEEVIITAKEGQRLIPLPEGASYLGFIFARGTDPAEVEEGLRKAHARLRFTITHALPTLR